MGKVLRKRRRVWRAGGHVRGIVASRRRPQGASEVAGRGILSISLVTSSKDRFQPRCKTTVFPAFHRAEFTKPADSFRLEFGRGKVKGWWTPAFTRNARRREPTPRVEISISIIEVFFFCAREDFFSELNSTESRAKFPKLFFFMINFYLNSRGDWREINIRKFQHLNYIFATRRGEGRKSERVETGSEFEEDENFHRHIILSYLWPKFFSLQLMHR